MFKVKKPSRKQYTEIYMQNLKKLRNIYYYIAMTISKKPFQILTIQSEKIEQKYFFVYELIALQTTLNFDDLRKHLKRKTLCFLILNPIKIGHKT